MKRHQESHLDHGLTPAQVDHIFKLFADRREFFTAAIELPPELGTAPCALWGPAMGDPEILDGTEVLKDGCLPPGEYIYPDNAVTYTEAKSDRSNASVMVPSFIMSPATGAITYAKRLPRTWDSRLIDLPCRPTRKIFVVGGPHEEHACILYTAYAGAEAPQEPTDPKISSAKLEGSKAFWAVHALSRFAL